MIKNKGKKIIGRVLLATAVLFFLCWLIRVFSLAPDLLSSVSFGKVIFDRNLNCMRMFLSSDEQYRIRSDYHSYPRDFREILLLQEDGYFYFHPGVNPVSLGRAFYHSFIKKDRLIGASTITMQTARMLFKLNTSHIRGKIVQTGYAVLLSLFYSKKEILYYYMNLAPCGGNIEGFQAASIYYFGKPVDKISAQEQMMLCVLPQDPAARKPSPDLVNTELNEAVYRLYKKWIRKHPQESLNEELVRLTPTLTKLPFTAPHFSEYCFQKYKKSADQRKNDFILTTLDHKLQWYLENRIRLFIDENRDKGILNASAVLLDHRSMEIMAYVGSGNYFDEGSAGQVNGVEARRSPGSLFKPFIYQLAVDQGLIHSHTVLKDAPTSFGSWTPDNYRTHFTGISKVWSALQMSRNIPAIDLASRLKNTGLYEFLVQSGIPLQKKEHYGLSLILGSAEISLSEAVRLYASLPNGGVMKEVKYLRTDTSLNKPLHSLASRESAYMIMNILKNNPRAETFQSLSPVMYKTGTSIGFRDSWSAGIFNNYVLAVWIGNFSGEGNEYFVGRYIAAPLFFQIVKDIKLSGIPDRECDPFPADYYGKKLNIKEVEVCAVSGMIPGKYCKSTEDAWFIPGVSPIGICNVHRPVYIHKKTGYRVNEKDDSSYEDVRVFWPSDVVELLKEANIPVNGPPPFQSDIRHDQFQRKPVIQEPLNDLSYIAVYSKEDKALIPFKASADSGVERLYWYVNGIFSVNSLPGKTFTLEFSPGVYDIHCLDNLGLSDFRKITVEARK